MAGLRLSRIAAHLSFDEVIARIAFAMGQVSIRDEVRYPNMQFQLSQNFHGRPRSCL
jgi:hypothetical protein